jgi:hypothetical protein
MDWLIPLIVVLVVVVAVSVALKMRSREPEAYPYTMTRVLFSPAERSFLGSSTKQSAKSIACSARSASRTS